MEIISTTGAKCSAKGQAWGKHLIKIWLLLLRFKDPTLGLEKGGRNLLLVLTLGRWLCRWPAVGS